MQWYLVAMLLSTHNRNANTNWCQVIVFCLWIECDCYLLMDWMWLLSDCGLKDPCLSYTQSLLQRSHAHVIFNITETNHYGDVTWVWWRLSSFRLAKKKMMKLPTQNLNNVKRVSMLWHHHMIHTVTAPNRYWIQIHRILPAANLNVVEN